MGRVATRWQCRAKQRHQPALAVVLRQVSGSVHGRPLLLAGFSDRRRGRTAGGRARRRRRIGGGQSFTSATHHLPRGARRGCALHRLAAIVDLGGGSNGG